MPAMDADPAKQGSNGILTSTDSSENDVPKETSPRPIHGWKWAIAYASMISTTFLFALDNTIVADIQPVILDLFGEVPPPMDRSRLCSRYHVCSAMGQGLIRPPPMHYGRTRVCIDATGPDSYVRRPWDRHAFRSWSRYRSVSLAGEDPLNC